MEFSRYAIYAVPEGPLYLAGARWLGWDAESGREISRPHFSFDWQTLTERPARYGFHATLRAPFSLAAGVLERDVHSVCEQLATSLSPVSLGQLRLQRLGRFLALTAESEIEVGPFAADIVRQTNPLRAALSETEISKRIPKSFPEQGLRNLQDWGYPHVMEYFRFHMTLTSKLSKADLSDVETAANDWFAAVIKDEFRISSLALMGEEAETKRFHLLKRFYLS